jgi:hypothetical protein
MPVDDWYENDPALDCEHDKRSVMPVVTAKLERRLRYWREREDAELMRRYRAITSV